MSDQGSHGGASYSETRVPLAFLSTQHRSSTGQSVTIVVKLWRVQWWLILVLFVDFSTLNLSVWYRFFQRGSRKLNLLLTHSSHFSNWPSVRSIIPGITLSHPWPNTYLPLCWCIKTLLTNWFNNNQYQKGHKIIYFILFAYFLNDWYDGLVKFITWFHKQNFFS